jgi:hypothetical protein
MDYSNNIKPNQLTTDEDVYLLYKKIKQKNVNDEGLTDEFLCFSQGCKNKTCCRQYCRKELGLKGSEKTKCKSQCFKMDCDTFKSKVESGEIPIAGKMINDQLTAALQDLTANNDQTQKQADSSSNTGMYVLIGVIVLVMIVSVILLIK